MKYLREKAGSFAAKVKGAEAGYEIVMAALQEKDIVEGIVKFHTEMNRLNQSKPEEVQKAKVEAINLGVSQKFFELLAVPAEEIRALAVLSSKVIDDIQNELGPKLNRPDLSFNDTKGSRGKRVAVAASFAAAINGALQDNGISPSDLLVASTIESNPIATEFVRDLTRAFSQRFVDPAGYRYTNSQSKEPIEGLFDKEIKVYEKKLAQAEKFELDKPKLPQEPIPSPLYDFADPSSFWTIKSEKKKEILSFNSDPEAFNALSQSAAMKVSSGLEHPLKDGRSTRDGLATEIDNTRAQIDVKKEELAKLGKAIHH